MTELRGRVALVTGASGGIGAAIVERLVAEHARVAVHYGSHRHPADELAARVGGVTVVVGADLRDPAAPEQLVDAVEEALGPVDVLVANAGHSVRKAWEDVDLELWEETQAVNLRAPFFLAQRTIPHMREQGWGRILFTSSVASFTGGIVGPHYASSKAGVNGLAHFLASRLAGEGITVNAIAPALIEETRMLPGDPGELAQRIPVGRLGKPAEVADVALAILRNGYVTNQVVSVDGGNYPR